MFIAKSFYFTILAPVLGVGGAPTRGGKRCQHNLIRGQQSQVRAALPLATFQ
jgi:hypothetical protein